MVGPLLVLNITQLQDKFRLRHLCFYISLLIIQRPPYLHKGPWVIMMTRPILKRSCFILFIYILYLQSKDLKIWARLIWHRRLHWHGVIAKLDKHRSVGFLGIHIWICIMLAHRNNSPWVHMSLHSDISWFWANHACSFSLMLRAQRRNSKYQFYSLWFDTTEARTQDLQHSRRAC